MFSRFRPAKSQSVDDATTRESSPGLQPEPDAALDSGDRVGAAEDQAPELLAKQERFADDDARGSGVAESASRPSPDPQPPLVPTTEVEPDDDQEPSNDEEPAELIPDPGPLQGLPFVTRRPRGRRLSKPQTAQRHTFTAQQRLLLLDTWRRSGLPAKDFAGLVGVSKHTLYKWKQLFDQHGPAGLADQPRGARPGSRLPDLTRRAILMLKETHPDWGCQRISDTLLRGPAVAASASAVARVLHEAGYETIDQPTHRHPDKIRRFERAKPNQLWQTDLFTFVLKRQNRRVHLVAFMDDHSRFIVCYGLHASASTALVLEALEAGLSNYGPPEEILTDNGPQYVTWRGTSQFSKHLAKRGIKQIVARPRRPQTLGKIERFWGTMWREFLEAAVFVDLADARTRIGCFIDYYNFQRVHRGIEGLVPADRFFGAAQDVLRTLKERVAANALELAQHGPARQPFYVTGSVDGKTFSLHAEGQRLVLRRENESREEITLNGQPSSETDSQESLPPPVCPEGSPPTPPDEPATAPPAAPGTSQLDQFLEQLQQLDASTAKAESPDEAKPDTGTEGGDV